MATRILYIHHRAQISGAARSLAELISCLGDEWDATVLTPNGPVVDLFSAAGAQVQTSPVALLQHTWDSPYVGRKWLLLAREALAAGPHLHALDRLLRRGDFSVVHLNDSPLLPAAACSKRHGLPVIWHLRSALSSRGAVRQHLVRGAIDRWGDEAIAIDEDVRNSFQLGIPSTVVFNSVTIPSGVPTKAEARRRLGLPSDHVTVGFIGNLRRIKGWPEFVDAAALLRDEPVHFVVAGGGVRPASFFRSPYGRATALAGLSFDDETQLQARVHGHGLDNRFTLLPFTNAMAEVYAALDIVAFPNQGTGLGRPVLEAAAFGVPAIGSGSPSGAGVLIAGETGILLERGTAEAIAEAVRRLVRDPGLREKLGGEAAAHARSAFDPERAAAAVTTIYNRVTAPGR